MANSESIKAEARRRGFIIVVAGFIALVYFLQAFQVAKTGLFFVTPIAVLMGTSFSGSVRPRFRTLRTTESTEGCVAAVWQDFGANGKDRSGPDFKPIESGAIPFCGGLFGDWVSH
jgi:hypothetical protein